MKKNENNVKRIYDKQTKTWFEVSPEQYEEFDRCVPISESATIPSSLHVSAQ